jgi:YihY family inner membrane protein
VDALTHLITRVDRFQQGKRPLAIGWAVNKKYSDDRGSDMAALVAYYGLLSILPLMLVFFSLVLFFLDPRGKTVRTLDRHLSSFPIIGSSIKGVEGGHLGGSTIAVVIGLLGLAWGAQGLAQTLQHLMNQIWNIPQKIRPGFVPRLLTTAKWYTAFGVGVVLSTYLSSLAGVFDWGPAGPVLAALPAFVVNATLFVLSFRLLTPAEIETRDLIPGAITAGVIWTILTGLGVSLVQHQLNHASALYGSIGGFLGILGFIYLAARLTLYCAEYNVVRARHIWPRTMRQQPLTTADKQQLVDMARREERVDDETVRVEF